MYIFKLSDQQLAVINAGLLELPGKIGVPMLHMLEQQKQQQPALADASAGAGCVPSDNQKPANGAQH